MKFFNSTAETTRPLRTLHAQMLTDAELEKLDMFVRISSPRMACEWKLVAGGHVDVLLIDGDEPHTIPGLMDNPSFIVRVVNRPSGDFLELVRPLFYDPFVEFLKKMEKPDLASEMREAAAKLRVAAAQPAPSKTPGFLHSVPASAGLRLRRWPPSAVLQASRHNTRLATFLSTRHLTLNELARLSNVELAQCRQFVHMLNELGMLDVETLDAAPVARAPTPVVQAAGPIAAAGSGFDGGLFGLIRRRLGLVAAR